MKFHSIQIDKLELKLPGGRASAWQVASYRNKVLGVGVLGVLQASDEIVLIRNYRPPLGRWNLEVAGGLAFPNEAAPDAAKREFEEETGCRVLRIASGPQLYLQPGLGYFPVACFIAEAEPGNRQKLDNNEYIAPVFISATAKEIERQKATINEPVSLVLLEYFLRTRIKNPKKRH